MTDPAKCYCGSISWERTITENRFTCCSCKRPLWQPIETAPKDHSLILLSGLDEDGVKVVDMGHWESFSWWHGEHSDPEWSWTYENQPTHWMPLPEPPCE
jgi:hypothetical protein